MIDKSKFFGLFHLIIFAERESGPRHPRSIDLTSTIHDMYTVLSFNSMAGPGQDCAHTLLFNDSVPHWYQRQGQKQPMPSPGFPIALGSLSIIAVGGHTGGRAMFVPESRRSAPTARV